MKIMKFIYGVVCVALAGGLLTACTNDEDVVMKNDGTKMSMTFTAGSVLYER